MRPTVAGLLIAAGIAVAAPAAELTPLFTDLPGAAALAASPNGQTVYCVDAERDAIVSFDPFAPARRRDVIVAGRGGGMAFAAVGCLAGDVLATVCRAGDAWSVCTYRVRPGGAADADTPLQRRALGASGGSAGDALLAVSDTRDWLAVVGLPRPLPPVIRGAFAGVSLGPLGERGAPRLPAGTVPAAAAVSPGDELVLVERGVRGDLLSYHDTAGRELLRLDTGLPGIRGLAFGRGAGTLWAVGGVSGSVEHPEGLWRLDAVLRGGRQAVRPECVVRLPAPRALACVSATTLVVVHGAAARTVVRVDVGAPAAKEDP